MYAFLYRNDKKWLKENSPKKERISNDTIIDWDKRDILISKEIVKAAKNILKQVPPKRITVSSIGSEIGRVNLLQRHLKKLPKCKSTLKVYLEDVVSFQIRRVMSILQNLRVQNEEISEWKVVRMAGLKSPLNPKVELLIKNLLRD